MSIESRKKKLLKKQKDIKNHIKKKNRARKKHKLNFSKNESYALLPYKNRIFVYNGIRKDSNRREPETIKWIEECMSTDDMLFDVGANIGAYSLIAASNSIKVYSFEPSATTFLILLKNIMKNKFGSRIVPLSIPLSNKCSLDYFNYYDLMGGSSTHTFGAAIDYTGKKFKPVFKQLTMSMTIDDLVFAHNVQCPNHLKIDVDGNELQILEGAVKVLACDSLKTICVEVINNVSDELGVSKLLSKFSLIKDEGMGSKINKIYRKK